jgi:hypothetical protein
MKQLLITAMSAVPVYAKRMMLALLLLGFLAGKSQGASIVHVTYIQNDQTVWAGIYTGSDGGAGSDPGQVKLDSLRLVCDRADSDKWRLPKDELQRVLGLVGAVDSKPPDAAAPGGERVRANSD